MKTVGSFEAKTHLSQLLNEVEMYNEKILIQRRGKDVAYIVPCGTYDNNKRQKKSDSIVKVFQRIRKKQQSMKPGEIHEMVNDGRKW